MTDTFKKLFHDKTMGFKLTLSFILVALIPMLLLSFISFRRINTRLYLEAEEKLKIGIKTAWTKYYEHGDQMRYGMLQAASMTEVREAVSRRNSGDLRNIMAKWKERRPYADIWIIVDEQNRVISRVNSDLKDDIIDLNGLVSKVLTSGKSEVSTEILHSDILDREGDEFHRQLITPIAYHSTDNEYNRDGGKRMESDTIALVSVTPIADNSHKPFGAIIVADVLTNETHITSEVSSKLPWIFTSISMDGLRIDTNIVDRSGQTARGTILPAPVMSNLKLNKPVLGKAMVLDQEFIAIFEPIMDHKGKVIGSLDVGLPSAKLWALQKENMIIVTGITALGLLMAFSVSVLMTYKITRPLWIMKEKANAFAGGDLDAKIHVDGEEDTRNELTILARAFNSMMDDVKKRNLEREINLVKLDEKNRQLLEINEQLKTTNEELEVSYEEVQSQTEELNAANEELKIVNEDLENKNAELRDASIKIIQEKEEQRLLQEKLTHSEKLSSIGELVSGVAHELNNPLTAIMGLSGFLLDKELPETVKQQIKIINDASHRSKRIIDNLLIFARSEKPKKKYQDLNDVIRGTAELLEYQLRVENIDLELKLDPDLPRTMLDEHQLQQVFLNLINNSKHSISEKGGRGNISISTGSEGANIVATFSDNGKGIPDDILKKIFDPFFTTKGVGAGTGLGLSISYGIIEEHGGEISVASIPGEGATFSVTLPVIKASEECELAATIALPGEKLTVKGLRVLVLDDEHAIIAMLETVLSDAGLQVDTAGAGDEALSLLKKDSYDLIISDIKMKGMNGKEFYRKVKELRPGTASKIIFISGDSVSAETQNFLRETGNQFLKKPFNIDELMAAISKGLPQSDPKRKREGV